MEQKNTTPENRQLVLPDSTKPEELVLLPATDRPVFPGMVVPMVFADKTQQDIISFVMKNNNNNIGIVLSKNTAAAATGETAKKNQTPSKNDIHQIGCLARIMKTMPSPNNENEVHVLFSIQKRFAITKIIKNKPYLVARVRYPAEKVDINDEHIQAYISALISKIKELIKLNAVFSEEMKLFISKFGSNAPGQLSDMVTNMLTTIGSEEMQDILATFNIAKRLPKVLNFIQKEVEVARIKERINKNIEDKISQQQRKFFLQEQLKQIKQELGMEKDEKAVDIENFRKKMKSLELSKEAQKVLEDELNKLSFYDVRSAEYGVVRNYIQSVLALPWGIYSTDNFDLKNVAKILDRDHYGLQDIKERIIEFVAVQKLKKTAGGNILCFVGAPGVGKTSLGRSIANALQRKYYNFSVGGMRDEAEIKGHRRTYIGAMPGKIIQALKSAGTSNPVIMLDEIEKLSSSYHGDPSSALLEVLDPEQNYQFLDHYLDIRFDLSKVLFIATANHVDTIPPALLDRMEVIRLAGYLKEEKKQIARRHLLPKQIKNHGLKTKDISFKMNAIAEIITSYAREAGVRNLEKNINTILRKTARQKAEGSNEKKVITSQTVKDMLGSETFKEEAQYDKVEPGIVSGLAWTSLGGSVLHIEAVKVADKENSG
ncbi:MAG TPA: endopeptidase La, partial [Spirochaetota bacterium]|nr:endopeptidase La [Spirochaetota bacterium]